MRQRRGQGPGPADTGSATIEAVIIAPVIILLITVAVVLGRIATFHEAVQQAVQAAARSGSMSRSKDLATTASTATWAQLVADSSGGTLPSNNIHCDSPQGTPILTGFDTVPGSPDSIAVNGAPAGAMFAFQATCTLKSEWLLGIFSTDLTVTETAYSPLDPYRCKAVSGC
ncbi:TadE family protein [Catenulispora subtropica]|uniref:TadE-like domain-containing protein n=1 Tax=Catenulispora subtropica TaxID=450798 RepID=A0ABP5D7A7_9ACTN